MTKELCGAKYRFIRRYLMLHYPKIALEVMKKIELMDLEGIKAITPTEYLGVYDEYRKAAGVFPK